VNFKDAEDTKTGNVTFKAFIVTQRRLFDLAAFGGGGTAVAPQLSCGQVLPRGGSRTETLGAHTAGVPQLPPRTSLSHAQTPRGTLKSRRAARRKSLMYLVAWDGIEPPTRGFSGPVPLGRTEAFSRGEVTPLKRRVPQWSCRGSSVPAPKVKSRMYSAYIHGFTITKLESVTKNVAMVHGSKTASASA